MANHDDAGVDEIRGGTMGRFGTTKGALLTAGSARRYTTGEEVFCTYGPKSAAEYLLEHGFLPSRLRDLSFCVAELSFEITPPPTMEDGAEPPVSFDPLYDDRLDVLEYDTYDDAPMSPVQTFDVVADIALPESTPDPSMIRFLRLAKLSGKDAFLLESVFRKEVWEFMGLPVSERNERAVLDAVAEACEGALGEMVGDVGGGEGEGDRPEVLCKVVRSSEGRALGRTLEFVQREKEALDLKEYYQERRLKDLGLDSEWSGEGGEGKGAGFEDDELGYGQIRAPGSMDW